MLRGSNISDVMGESTNSGTQLTPIVYILDDQRSAAVEAGETVASMDLLAREIPSLQELVNDYDSGRDGCLICELPSGDDGGAKIIRTIEAHSVLLPVIFIAREAKTSEIVEVMRAGAVTVIDSPVDRGELEASIIEAIHRDMTNRQGQAQRRSTLTRIAELTDKERAVMDMVVEGRPNKVIAKRMGVSIRTIESRRQSVFQKMGVGSLAELVRRVVEAEAEAPRHDAAYSVS